MKLSIAPPVVDAYPDLTIGVVLARGIDNAGTSADLRRLAIESAERLTSTLGREGLSTHPHIVAWRDTYRSFGAKPKKTRPTAEALARRVTGGKEPPTVSKAVDSYLVAELDWLLPVGGYDLASLTGDVVLRRSPGGEEFTAIGRTDPEPTEPGEIVYADDAGILTRRWNYSDCDRAKITEVSRDIALFVEGAHSLISADSVRGCAEQIAELLGTFCGGTIETLMLRAQESASVQLSRGAESRSA